MKKSVLLITILLFVFKTGHGQTSDSTRKQLGLVVKTDIFQPLINGATLPSNDLNFKLFNAFSITAEKLLKKRHSVQLTFIKGWTGDSYTEYNVNISNTVVLPSVISTDKSHAWSLIPEYKFFVSKKKAHTGYYIGAFGYFNYYYDNYIWGHQQIITNQVNIGGGISNGVQFYIFKRITIDALLELGVLSGNPVYNNVVITNPYISPADLCGCVTQPPIQFYGRFAINIGYKF